MKKNSTKNIILLFPKKPLKQSKSECNLTTTMFKSITLTNTSQGLLLKKKVMHACIKNICMCTFLVMVLLNILFKSCDYISM